jgi:hypothetical protein
MTVQWLCAIVGFWFGCGIGFGLGYGVARERILKDSAPHS